MPAVFGERRERRDGEWRGGATGLGLSRQAISQHLAVLESAGLVTTRRQGRYKFHGLNTEPLGHIVNRWLTPDTPESSP